MKQLQTLHKVSFVYTKNELEQLLFSLELSDWKFNFHQDPKSEAHISVDVAGNAVMTYNYPMPVKTSIHFEHYFIKMTGAEFTKFKVAVEKQGFSVVRISDKEIAIWSQYCRDVRNFKY